MSNKEIGVIGLILGFLLGLAYAFPTTEGFSFKNKYKAGECVRALGKEEVMKIRLVTDYAVEFSQGLKLGLFSTRKENSTSKEKFLIKVPCK